MIKGRDFWAWGVGLLLAPSFLVQANPVPVIETSPASQSAETVEVQAEESVYVDSVFFFHVHVTSHIDRVVSLGLALHEEYSDRYSELDRETVREFLELHDRAKTMGVQELGAYDYDTSQGSLLSRLYNQLYGVDLRELPQDQQQEAKALVAELNRIDRAVRDEFLLRRDFMDAEGNLTSEGELLLEIEQLADLVDRGQSPVSPEEFARPMKPASEFLDDAFKVSMARFLEGRYHQVTRGQHPLELRRRSQTPRVDQCVRLFNSSLTPAVSF